MNRPSVADPVSWAAGWTARVLFRPFDPAKWLVIGFGAWIASLGEGGGPPRYDVPDPDASGETMRETARATWDQIMEHLVWILPLFAALLVLLVGLAFLVIWISSRGKFVFLDQVLQDRRAVAEPWRRYASQGNGLFVFRIVLGLGSFLAVLALLVPLGIWLWRGSRGGLLDVELGLGLVIWVMGFVALVVLLGLIQLGVDDLLVPVLYLRRCGVVAGLREVGDMLAVFPGTFALYALIRLLMVICVAAIVFVAVFCTCCVVLIPYIGTVLLLPIHVFWRSYSLAFLSQLGEGFAPLAVLQGEASPPGDARSHP